MDWINLPPLSALRAFTALAETGSFTAAGAALNVSHAAISQQVRGLEERLGTVLVGRSGRRVTLTPEGEQLAATLTPAFASMARVVEALTGGDATRPLQITTSPAFAGRWLMPRLSDFRLAHPDIELMLNPTPEVIELTPGGVDVAVRFGTGRWPGVNVEPLQMTSLVIVGARSLVGSRNVRDPRELLDFPWLLEIGTNEMSDWLASRGVVTPRKENVTHLPGNLVFEALLDGTGITVAARSHLAREIDDGRVRVLFEQQTPNQGYYVVTRPGVMRPPLKAFVQWIRRHAE